MSHDVDCPYCGAPQEICHDDGYGYDEGKKHNQECGKCGKSFVYQTFISFDYEVEKADCLNGAAHEFKPSRTYPKQYTKMVCQCCEEERKPTAEELAEIMQEAKP